MDEGRKTNFYFLFSVFCHLSSVIITRDRKMRCKSIFTQNLWFLLFLVTTMCPATIGRVIYVDDDATGTNNGSSWQNAYVFLQDALTNANSTEKPVEIRVAQGIYKPDQGSGQTPGNREATFQLINGVILSGGYAGIGVDDPNARDIELYETILSGDLLGNDVEVKNPSDLTEEPTRAENSYHIVTSNNTDNSALLDGFIITGGNADGSDYYDCGAGIFNPSGSPKIMNCTFHINYARWEGSGIYNHSSSPVLTNCTFIGNRAAYGGGMYNTTYSHPVLTDCKFIGNFSNYGGGMDNEYSCNPVLTNCTFSGTSRYKGGGIRNYKSNPILTNCIFIGNSSREGAGMNNYDSHLSLTNCTFTGNKADNGGAMDNERYSQVTLTNCTFSGNIAEVGNALACDTYSTSPHREYPSIIDLVNCIIWDGGNEIWNEDGSTINITYSDIPNSQIAIYDPCEAIVWGQGNINTDPLFIDADGDDNVFGTEDDDLRLLESSLCIDAGNNSAVLPSIVTDIQGNQRIVNGRVDMGSHEKPATYFLINPQSLIVPEGETATFSLALAEPPSETVEITVVYYSGDRDITVESGGSLSFDISNYSIPQTFVLSAAEDNDNLNGITRIRLSTPNLFVDYKVTEADNEPYVGVLFVDDDATGANNGTSWENAYSFLQDALNTTTNIGVQEIRVAQGIYQPDRGGGNIPDDKEATFQLINSVVIKGGFAGVSEADPDVRNIELYKTILSGDLADNDFDTDNLVVLPYEATRIDNSYHIVTGSGTTSTALLDGFTIVGGNATYPSPEDGGGIYNKAGSPTITNCTFSCNWAWSGGGMYNSNCSPTLGNCIFNMNASAYGGGIHNRNSNMLLTDCIFTDNITVFPPGGIYERNRHRGGGMYNGSSNPTLINCTFSKNSSWIGGGIYNSGSNPILTSCTFMSNCSNLYGGGGIYNSDSNPNITNSIFIGNSTDYETGSGIYGGNPILVNCTLTGNQAREGGAISRGEPTLINCIVWGNTSPQILSDASVSFSNIQDGFPGEGNIDIDPLFADPENGDYHLKSQGGRWNPNTQSWVIDDVTSPCIDAGDPNMPVGDEPEPNGGIINMGAYGGTAEASKSVD